MSLYLPEPINRTVACFVRARARVLLLAVLAMVACGEPDTGLQQTHTYMDSLRVYLGELRLMDHQVSKMVDAEAISADIILPVIAERLRPTVDGLRQRADGLQPTPVVSRAHTLLLSYLDVRLQAYDAALQGQANPELFELFELKQTEAQLIGRDLADESQRLLTQVPGYR